MSSLNFNPVSGSIKQNQLKESNAILVASTAFIITLENTKPALLQIIIKQSYPRADIKISSRVLAKSNQLNQ
jgi:hypothetical protein